jgi:hypothetical protein
MFSPAPQLPLDLGRPVRHRSDPGRALGTVVGCLFDAPHGLLVRWEQGQLTLEGGDALDDLKVEVSTAGSIAEQIRDRLEQGLLGLAEPETTSYVRLTQWQRCDGCMQLMAPGRDAMALAYLAPPRLVRLHRGCHGLWELARRAIIGERTSVRAERARSTREPQRRGAAAKHVPVSTATVTTALLAVAGLTVSALQAPVLTPEAMRVLRPLLEAEGFDLERPIRVRELSGHEGFRLTQ